MANSALDLATMRSTPIPSPVVPFAHGSEYRTALRARIQAVQLVETDVSRELLIPVSDVGLLGNDYYYQLVRHRGIPDESLRAEALRLTTPTIWLRSSIARSLAAVDQRLRSHGLRLYLMSGYRSPALQTLVRHLATIEQGEAFTERMLSRPEVHLPHATGAAFDIELWDERRNNIIPTKVPDHFERDYLENKTHLNSLDQEVRANRRLLHHLLTTDVVLPKGQEFVPHPFEYWHHSRHEKLATVFASFYGYEHEAHYAEISHFPTNHSPTIAE